MYGFTGHFRLLRSEWVEIADAYSAIAGSPENRPGRTGFKRIARNLRSWSRRLRGKQEREKAVYLLWEFEAVKPRA
jgi:hypothetical protein